MNKKIKDAFSDIHADEHLKNKTFHNIVNQRKRIPIYYKIIPVMAGFALFILGNIYFTPVSYISIDINPSIELEVNTFDRVITASASNEDGESVLESLELENKNYVEVLDELHAADSFADYGESYTEITVVSDSEKSSTELIENISDSTFMGDNVTCYAENEALRNEASEYDVSFGKYRAYLELQEVNPSIAIEEIEALPMRDIREMIENDGELVEESTEQGNQNGEGNGGAGAQDGSGNGAQDGNGTQNGNGVQDGSGSSGNAGQNGSGSGNQQGIGQGKK